MWTFEQSTGIITQPDGKTPLTAAYSGGNLGRNPEGKNNPAKQNVPMVGPLPQGKYSMTELIPLHPALGPYVIVLTPDPANEMFGRSDFCIHGDSVKRPGCASEGCIVAPWFVREAMWQSDDHALEVVR